MNKSATIQSETALNLLTVRYFWQTQTTAEATNPKNIYNQGYKSIKRKIDTYEGPIFFN